MKAIDHIKAFLSFKEPERSLFDMENIKEVRISFDDYTYKAPCWEGRISFKRGLYYGDKKFEDVKTFAEIVQQIQEFINYVEDEKILRGKQEKEYEAWKKANNPA